VALQARVPVLPGDTVESLSAAFSSRSTFIYPQVIGWIAAGRLRWVRDTLQLDGRPLPAPSYEEP